MNLKGFITAVFLLLSAGVTIAQQADSTLSTNETGSNPGNAQAVTDSILTNDKAGINPLNVSAFAELTYEYDQPMHSNLQDETISFRTGFKFKNTRLNLNAKLPYIIASQPEGEKLSGFGNIVLGANYVPYITNRYGITLMSEFNLTTGDENFNSEKNNLTLGAGFVFYQVGRSIITPYYKQTFTVSNHSNNNNTNQGIIGLRYSLRSKDNQKWLTLNSQASFNYTNGNNFYSGTAEAGFVFHRSFSMSIKPGISTSGDDGWSLALTLKKIF